MTSSGYIFPKFLPPASHLLYLESVMHPGLVFSSVCLSIKLKCNAPATVNGFINDPGS